MKCPKNLMMMSRFLKAVKKFSKYSILATKVAGVSIVTSFKYWRKEREIRRAMLNRFSVKQLNEIARRKGISWKWKDFLTGEIYRAKTKEEKVERLADKLSLKTIIKFARAYKIKHQDLLDELDKFRTKLIEEKSTVKTSSYYSEILQALEEFKPEHIRDERELVNQICIYLRAKFPGLKVRKEVSLKGRMGEKLRADIVIGDMCIEVKIPSSRTHLQRLIGQIDDYSQYYDHLVTFILDIGKVRGISKIVDRLEREGIKVITKSI
ncbi:MAG: hypothetical protein AYL29_004630 [Candidatus Bathyarchaeota archaeon B24]|nr:MAG: hypothetical protein AYL29_004630 [Candidatus Bathyarchaeota archaeon B24]